MAWKPINIRWIRTGSQPHSKIMYSIVLQTIFNKFHNKNGANKTGVYLIIFISFKRNCLQYDAINNYFVNKKMRNNKFCKCFKIAKKEGSTNDLTKKKQMDLKGLYMVGGFCTVTFY